jgi:hypothetical protein
MAVISLNGLISSIITLVTIYKNYLGDLVLGTNHFCSNTFNVQRVNYTGNNVNTSENFSFIDKIYNIWLNSTHS